MSGLGIDPWMHHIGAGFAGGGGATSMPVLANHAIGIDASSFVDPGGASSRRVVSNTITNKAAGSSVTLAPHFDPGNLPILHSGDWVRDATTISAPGTQDWFSNNRSTRDTDFGLITEIEMDFTGAASVTGHTVVLGIYISSLDGAVWTSPFWSNTSNARVAMNSSTGRIDVVTPDGGTDANAVADNDSTGWSRDAWHLWAFGLDEDTFWSSIDGVESTYTNNMADAGGAFALTVGPWGTLADAGFTFIHYWDQMHSLATMRPTLAYLASTHGLSYTAP